MALFAHKASTLADADKLKPVTSERLQKIVMFEIEKAVDFAESEISPDRQRAEIYYQGGTALKYVPGRSRVVVSKVRDAVKSVIPSIARIFTQSDNIAIFESTDEEDEKMCVDQTTYCNNIFKQYGGYVAFIEAVTDALKAKLGVILVGFEKKQVAAHEETGVLTQEQLDELDEDEDYKLTEVSDEIDMIGPDGQPTKGRQAVVTRLIHKDCYTIDCMPPETFIISPGATCAHDARLHGFRYMERIYNLLPMGIDYKTIIESGIESGDGQLLDMEKVSRDGFDYIDDAEAPVDDPAAREVLFCNIWLRIDADGDGVPELRNIWTVGDKHTIVHDVPVQYSPVALFKAELTPHAVFSQCLAEDLQQDQDAMTALLRSILDNCALVNSPRTVLNEQMVNVDDAKNNDIGVIIRARQMGQIEELVTPFAAGQTLPVLQVLNEMSEARSGVTKMSQGINPDALQSSPRMAANAAVQNADARIEMMARNIGETGVKDLFMAILRCAIHDKRGQAQVKQDAGYAQIDTTTWHDSISVTPKVGLGNGRIEERKETLQSLVGLLTQSIAQFGLSNPMGGYIQLRNAVKDHARLSGITNISDYLPPVDMQQLQQIDQQRAQAAKEQQPSTAGIVEAEKIKAQAKLQVEMPKLEQQGKLKAAELMQKGQIEGQQLQIREAADMRKAMMDDDRQRDKQDADFAIQAQKVQLDNATKLEVGLKQAATRPMPGAPK